MTRFLAIVARVLVEFIDSVSLTSLCRFVNFDADAATGRASLLATWMLSQDNLALTNAKTFIKDTLRAFAGVDITTILGVNVFSNLKIFIFCKNWLVM